MCIWASVEPKVAVVILNWNGWRDTIECLESLFKVSYQSMCVIVVDNGSTDDSIPRLREYCQDGAKIQSSTLHVGGRTQPVSVVEFAREDAVRVSMKDSRGTDVPPKRMIALIRNEQNYGFAEGCNIGMRYALAAVDPEYILLLNNDTVVDPLFLSELVKVGEADRRIGIIGPKILFYDFNGRNDIIWYAGGRIKPWHELVFKHVGNSEEDRGQYDSITETEWCTGAAFLLKSELAKNSLLNPVYPFGSEDVEYCIKMRKSGYKVVYVPSARVWHKVGASRAKLGKRIGRDIAGYLHFVRQNFSDTVYAYHVILFFSVVLPRWAFTYVLERGDRKTWRAFLRDIGHLIETMVGGSRKP
jgi:GT2 family glycosyltransferase